MRSCKGIKIRVGVYRPGFVPAGVLHSQTLSVMLQSASPMLPALPAVASVLFCTCIAMELLLLHSNMLCIPRAVLAEM